MQRFLLAFLILAGASVGSSANDFDDNLVAMPEQDRHAVLMEAARKAGDCDRVSRAEQMGSSERGDVGWSVACENGRSYYVTVYANPDFRPFASTCENLKDYGKMLGLMERRLNQPQSTAVHECWKKF